MRNLFRSFLVLALVSLFASPAFAFNQKLAKNGVQNVTTGAAPTIVSSVGQAIVGVVVTTAPGGGQFTLLYDTNLIDDEIATACFFDVYTPAATTQFYDFSGLGTSILGSTQGQGPAVGATAGSVAGTYSASQVSPNNGILLETSNSGGDKAAQFNSAVTVYVDASTITH